MWWRRRKQDQQLTAPKNNDVDWHEVAAGLWPELKTTQLIMRAALRDHRGPLLRGASSVDSPATSQEENLPAEVKTPSRPDLPSLCGVRD